MKKFANKVALVTGGSSGIGRKTAIAFGREGAKVAIASPRVAESEETVRLVKEAGGEAIFVPTDVTKATEVENLIGQTVAAYGRLDYAFNNAGIDPTLLPIVNQTEEEWDTIIDTNLKGMWLSLKYEIRQMLGQGGGAIVNNASVWGLVGQANVCIYSASKHGALGLTKSLALEYAKAGIRINAVCPGAIETEMMERCCEGKEEIKAQLTALHPVGRVGQPKEVADAVLWLCCDEASFVTGHSLAIDGGLTV